MSDSRPGDGWSTIQGLRQPEYTGENRCLPCTIVNLGIAAALGTALGVASIPAGALAFVCAAVVIYLRGYLVPGTPTLTKRYLPDPVLRLFGKDVRAYGVAGEGGITAGETLHEAGVVAADGAAGDATGVRLDPSVQAAVRDEIAGLSRADDDFDDRVATAFAVDPDETSAVGGMPAYSIDDRLLQWESTAALLADVALGTTLGELVDHWDEFDVGERARWLAAGRACLDHCPDCGGDLDTETQVPKTCCRDPSPVLLRTCTSCDARVLERNVDEIEGALGASIDADSAVVTTGTQSR